MGVILLQVGDFPQTMDHAGPAQDIEALILHESLNLLHLLPPHRCEPKIPSRLGLWLSPD